MSTNTPMSQSLQRIQNSLGALQYPSPFFEVAGTFLPKNISELFQWCRYYYMTNAVIHAGLSKIAVYPLTSLDYGTADEDLVGTWRRILETDLRFLGYLQQVAISTQVYGTALVSIGFPFRKMARCRACGSEFEVGHRGVKIRQAGRGFRVNRCPRCGARADVKLRDHYLKDQSGVKLYVWDLLFIRDEHNPITGESRYYVRIPRELVNSLQLGNQFVLSTTPQIFLDAAVNDRDVLLNADHLYAVRRVPIPGMSGAWGMPRVLPVLKNAFQMTVKMKAQEMLSLEHAVPLRVVHPAPVGDSTTSPYSQVNLRTWKDEIVTELGRWKRDPNYIPVTTSPVGYQELGGRGKLMMLSPEIRADAELVLAGMGIPTELVFGGVTWSGSSVSLRMLENTMLTDIQGYRGLLRWVVDQIGAYFDIPPIQVGFKKFKMADDLQRLTLNLQMAQSGILSRHTALSSADFDPDVETRKLEEEIGRQKRVTEDALLAQAEAQGKAQAIQARYQAQIQQELMTEQVDAQRRLMGEQMNMQLQAQQGQLAAVEPTDEQKRDRLRQAAQPAINSPDAGVAGMVAQLQQLPEDAARQVLAGLRANNPGLYKQVAALLKKQGPAGNDTGRPLPEQRPPRGPASM